MRTYKHFSEGLDFPKGPGAGWKAAKAQSRSLESAHGIHPDVSEESGMFHSAQLRNPAAVKSGRSSLNTDSFLCDASITLLVASGKNTEQQVSVNTPFLERQSRRFREGETLLSSEIYC